MSTNNPIPRKAQPPTTDGEEVVLVVVWGPMRIGKTTWINEARAADEANGLAPSVVVHSMDEATRHLQQGVSVYLETNTLRPDVPPRIQRLTDEIKFFGPNRLKVWMEEV